MIASLTSAGFRALFDETGKPQPETGALAGFLARRTREDDREPESATAKDFANPAQLLADLASAPLAEITTIAADRTEVHQVFCEDGLTARVLSLDGATCRIIEQASAQRIAAGFAEIIAPFAAAPPVQIELELSEEAAIALCAILDHLRMLFAASLLQRTALDTLAIGVEDLVEQVAQSEERPDYRWLVAILAVARNKAVGPVGRVREALESGCRELAGIGVIETAGEAQGGYFLPTVELIDLAVELMNPLPALVLAAGPDTGGEGYAARTLFRGSAIWLLETGGARNVLRSIDGLEAISLIAGHLKPRAMESAPERAVAASLPQEHEPRQFEPAGSNADAPEAARCPSCGAQRNAGARFCTRCGTGFP